MSLNWGRVSVVFCTGLLAEISLSFYKYYRTTSFQVQVICTRRVNIWLLLRNVTVIYHDISEVSRSIICRGHRLGQITHQQDTSTVHHDISGKRPSSMVVFSFNYWVNFFPQRIFHISFSHSLRKWSVIYIQNDRTMIKINMYFLIVKLRWFNFKSYTELYFPHIPNCCKNFLAIGSGRPLLLWINLDKSPPLQYSIMRKMYWSFHW